MSDNHLILRKCEKIHRLQRYYLNFSLRYSPRPYTGEELRRPSPNSTHRHSGALRLPCLARDLWYLDRLQCLPFCKIFCGCPPPMLNSEHWASTARGKEYCSVTFGIKAMTNSQETGCRNEHRLMSQYFVWTHSLIGLQKLILAEEIGALLVFWTVCYRFKRTDCTRLPVQIHTSAHSN